MFFLSVIQKTCLFLSSLFSFCLFFSLFSLSFSDLCYVYISPSLNLRFPSAPSQFLSSSLFISRNLFIYLIISLFLSYLYFSCYLYLSFSLVYHSHFLPLCVSPCYSTPQYLPISLSSIIPAFFSTLLMHSFFLIPYLFSLFLSIFVFQFSTSLSPPLYFIFSFFSSNSYPLFLPSPCTD